MKNPQETRNTKPLRQNTGEQQITEECKSTAEQQNAASLSTKQQNDVNLQNPPEPGRGLLGRLSTRQGVALLFVGSLFFILIAVAAALYFFIFRIRSTAVQPMLTPPTSLDELVKEFPELASILTDARLDSVFKDFLLAYQGGGLEAAYDLAKKRGLLNKNDDLVLTLELDTTDTASLKSELEAHGIIVATVSGNLMDIVVPMELIQKSIESGNPAGLFEDIAGLEHVRRIKMPITFQQDGSIRVPVPDMDLKGLSWPLKAGNVDIESLSVIGATDWNKAGFTGKGIRVGVLDSGGFDRYKDLLGTELPASVTARSFVYGGELGNSGGYYGSHETGCAEIIHDIAPDAELVFAEFRNEAEMIQAVDWLMSQGLWIISNSTGGSIGPFDGSSSRSKKVDRVVGSGVLWVNSAGNYALGHYRGAFTDQNEDGYHEFETGNQSLAFVAPSGSLIVLNWDDWLNGDQDFNLYIYDGDGKVIAASENIQNGPGSEPVEAVIYEFPDSVPYYASFYAVRATRQVVFDFFVMGEVQYPIPEYSLGSPADAHGSLSVGAVNWEDDLLEDYSSQGPTADGRLKPDIVAPTNVRVVSHDKPFTGTSGAAPHVAGAAALVWSVYPNYTNQQINEFLESRAIDLGASSPDNAFGYGRLWLGTGPESRSPPSPPEVTATHPETGTATPARRHTATPSSSSDSSKADVSLGMLICVVAPGLMGLGGIGLLGVILQRRRLTGNGRHGSEVIPMVLPDYPITPPVSPVPPPVSSPVAPEEPRIGPKVEGREICPRCGISHKSQARFCPVCGLALKSGPQSEEATAYCIYCGKVLLPNSKFCTKCGKPRPLSGR